jgi:hypothetical protein
MGRSRVGMLKMVVFPIGRDCLICGKVLLGKGPTFNLAMCPHYGLVPLGSGGLFLLHPTPHSCNLKAVQDLLKKYEKKVSKNWLTQ